MAVAAEKGYETPIAGGFVAIELLGAASLCVPVVGVLELPLLRYRAES